MAFFKFRKGDDASAASVPPSQAESVEAMRKRARQRLIGAAVLVLAAVIGFPLVFDTQPRPIAVDIPIDIPDRAKPRTPGVPSAAAAGAVAPAQAAATASPGLMKAEVIAEPEGAAASAPLAVAPAPAAAPAAVIASRPASKPEPRPAAAAAVASKPPADADRAKALLEGAEASVGASAAGEARFVVQVGAFAEPAKAAAARQKLEKAGLKTYTNVAETKEGKRTRVRVGPFTSRGEAEKAAAKVKGLELPAAVLTL